MTKKRQGAAKNANHDDIYQAFIEDCLDTGEDKTIRDRVLYTVFISWWQEKVGDHPPKIKKVADQLAPRLECFYSKDEDCLYYRADINEKWQQVAEGPCPECVEETFEVPLYSCIEDVFQPLEDFSTILNELSCIHDLGDLSAQELVPALRGVYGNLYRQAQKRIKRLSDGIKNDVGSLEIERVQTPDSFVFGDVVSVKVR